MLSIWEKESFISYRYIVVGSGITGISTALSLKEQEPDASVLVLERGLLPAGASTRNAGFACIGTVGEKMHDLQLMGEQQVMKLVQRRWEGLQLLRKRVGDAQMDYENWGGYELVLQNSDFDMGGVERLNQLLHPLFGEPIYREVPQAVQAFGFNPNRVRTLIHNKMDGQLHTGKMIQTLLKIAADKNITLLTGAEVLALDEHASGVTVRTYNPGLKSEILFEAAKVAVCTNAFSQQLLPDAVLQPGRGQVLLTSPVADLKLKGTFNFDGGFYYFRNLGNRVLFGGGRNLDFEGESTTQFGLTDNIQQQLEQYLEEMILPGLSFTITDRWSGIMAFGAEKQPELKQYSERIFAGIKLNGMGVALGSSMGRDLAQLMTR